MNAVGKLAAAVALAASAMSVNAVVISQIYGGGGNSGATYTHDFVELFNDDLVAVSLNGWSLQYTSATGLGLFNQNPVSLLPNLLLAPGQYFLVQAAPGAGGTTPLPTPDNTWTATLGASSGKVALVNVATGLGCNGGSTACSAGELASIEDLVGYGTANFFEGAGAAPLLSNTTAAFRDDGGCTDTNNNSADFSAGAPAPRNSSSPLNSCAPTGSVPEPGTLALLTLGLAGLAATRRRGER